MLKYIPGTARQKTKDMITNIIDLPERSFAPKMFPHEYIITGNSK